MKALIKIVFAILFLGQLVLFGLSIPGPPAQAETRQQMRERIVREYIAKYQVDVGCDAACVAQRETENPWLLLLAEQIGIDHADLTRASISHGIDWGFEFERTKHQNTDCALRSTPTLNRCAPTEADWLYSWASISEDFRHELDATPPLFKRECPPEDCGFRYAREYGGEY